MNNTNTASDDAQKAISMLKEAVCSILEDATLEGIQPGHIVNKLDIRESHNGWGTTQIVCSILHLLEKEGIAKRHSSEPQKWIRAYEEI